MSGGKGAARAAAALAVVALVAVAGWSSWQNRQAHTDDGAGRVAGAVRGEGVGDLVPPGCWTQTGMATAPDGGVGSRVSLSYCLEAAGASTMTLSEGDRPRCRAGIRASPAGERVRLAMPGAPECAFGDPLPRFDALCNAPEGDAMLCDIDWGDGLAEPFLLRRS